MPTRLAKRKKRLKAINGSQAKLTLFQRTLPFGLSGTAIMVLFYSSQGLNQKAISEQLGCSPANVCKIIKKLKNRGLLIQPKKRDRLTQTARSPLGMNLDVRFRSLKWKLTNPIEMPSDETVVNCGVTFKTWYIKDSTVRLNIGKKQYSLEIEAGYTEGNSMQECTRKHDEQCLYTYDWLCQHFPELAKVSNRLGYEVNRKGEITIPQMKELAEKWLETHPRMDAGIFKIDDSLKNGGEFQIKLDNIITKDDLKSLEAKIDASVGVMSKLSESISGLYNLFKKFIDRLEGTEEPKAPEPTEPLGHDYG
jgi:DNA-binding Lrp family transcriptional regulator